MMPPEHINLNELEAFLFDLDGVVTRTASVHATAWKRLFDDYLERRARAEGAAFVPFDPVIDYQDYVDGRPREAGVRSFLAARGVSLPPGSPDDGPESQVSPSSLTFASTASIFDGSVLRASRRRTCIWKRPGGSRLHRFAPSSSKTPSSAWKQDVPAGSELWWASDKGTTPLTSGRTVQISSSPTSVS